MNANLDSLKPIANKAPASALMATGSIRGPTRWKSWMVGTASSRPSIQNDICVFPLFKTARQRFVGNDFPTTEVILLRSL